MVRSARRLPGRQLPRNPHGAPERGRHSAITQRRRTAGRHPASPGRARTGHRAEPAGPIWRAARHLGAVRDGTGRRRRRARGQPRRLQRRANTRAESAASEARALCRTALAAAGPSRADRPVGRPVGLAGFRLYAGHHPRSGPDAARPLHVAQQRSAGRNPLPVAAGARGRRRRVPSRHLPLRHVPALVPARGRPRLRHGLDAAPSRSDAGTT